MKYLKLFDAEKKYLTYRDSKDYIKPKVSLCDDNGDVYYNYSSPFNGYDYVDLGLPSGTLWATCNVGASKPSDAGLYFQWGDTSGYTANQVGIGEGKKKFASDWSDYKWRLSGDSDSNVTFTKYTTPGATLELEDDAAHVNMGGDWHMPTPTQIQELLDNTTSAWAILDEVNGMKFTSKSDPSKSIFIPAVGFAYGGTVRNSGTEADVWSSMLNTDDNNHGQYLYFNSGLAGLYGNGRYGGFSVRGVVG